MSSNYQSRIRETKAAIKKAEERTLEAVGVFVESETVVRAPVLSGNLKGSYAHKVNMKDKSVSIGSPVDYAAHVEKGTFRSTAQPHLTPAAEDNQGRIKSLAGEMMKL